jgi:hypothetical protein
LGKEGGKDLLLRFVDGELADPDFAAIAAAGRGQAGEGEAGVNVFAMQGSEESQHRRRINDNPQGAKGKDALTESAATLE